MELQWTKNALEALLFACGEPVSTAQLAQTLELPAETVQHLLEDLQQEYAGPDRGLLLLQLEDRWQLATKSAFGELIKKILDTRRNTPLSQAALEVLAIVAYNQPVSRSFIDQVRGVDSGSAVQTLQARGLIEEAGRLDLPGHPVSFATTDTFLRCFDLESLTQLPPLHEELEAEEPQTLADAQEGAAGMEAVLENAQSTEDMENAENIDAAEGVQRTEDIESAEEVQHTENAEIAEDRQPAEGTENAENAQRTEDAESKERTEHAENAAEMPAAAEDAAGSGPEMPDAEDAYGMLVDKLGTDGTANILADAADTAADTDDL